MKSRIITTIALCLALAGCKQGIEFKDIVYFTGTSVSPEVSMYLEGPTTNSYTITSSCLMKEDVEFKIAVDNSAIEAFNADHATSYVALPSEVYELSTDTVTIPEGESVSSSFDVRILSIDSFEDGVVYCLPLKIASSSNGQLPVPGKEYIYLVLRRYVYVSGSAFNYDGYYSVPSMLADGSLYDLPACTMEVRVKMNSFYPESHNPGIASVIGVEENYLLRFGDISCDPDQLQLAGRGVSITTEKHFETGKWYHIAAVDDRTMIRIYANGELVAEASSSGKPAINLGFEWMDGFHIGYSERGRLMDGTVSEARVWRRALSASELVANQCALADPVKDAEENGLIAYWKLDDVNAGKDLTGNGYEAIPTSVKFTERNIRCPEK